MIKNQFNNNIAYTLILVSSLCISIFLDGALDPKEMFQDECEELITELKPYERQFCASIFHRDITKINDFLSARTSNTTQITPAINNSLYNILITTYPELVNKNKHIWQQQKKQNHPALNIVATLLTYLTYLSNNFCNQGPSDIISVIAYHRLLSLYPKANKPNVPSTEDQSLKILEVMHSIEGIIEYEQLCSSDTYFMIEYEQINTPSAVKFWENSIAPIHNEQSSTDESINIALENQPQADYDEKEEKNNSSSVQKKQTTAAGISESNQTAKLGPQIARLFLSERDSIFRDFKHFPS